MTGKFNIIVDSLSRVSKGTEKPVASYFLSFTYQVINFSLELLKEDKEKDPVIREISGDILTSSSLRPEYRHINGIVYKNPTTEGRCTRLYIPENLQCEVLELSHYSSSSGHAGIKKTC